MTAEKDWCGSCSVQAVDIHAHYGRYEGQTDELAGEFASAEVDEVIRRAQRSNIALVIVSPLRALFPRYKADPVAGNEDATKLVEEYDGLLHWVVVDPQLPETFLQAAEMLKNGKCPGMKIHPEEHGYLISECGRRVFEFAAEHRSVILTHSGEQRSLPQDFLPFADDFPEVTLILAHLGCGWDGKLTHQVRAVQNSKHGNIYIDTSSAMNITPGLLEWAVRELGADRLLFGTDSPLYFLPIQRARIDHAEISTEDKIRILRDNALRVLPIAKLYHHSGDADNGKIVA